VDLIIRLAAALGGRFRSGNEWRFDNTENMRLFIDCCQNLGFLPCEDWFLMSVFVMKSRDEVPPVTFGNAIKIFRRFALYKHDYEENHTCEDCPHQEVSDLFEAKLKAYLQTFSPKKDEDTQAILTSTFANKFRFPRQG